MQDLIGFTWTGDDGRKATVTGRWELGDSYVTIRYDDGDTAIRPIGVVRAYKRIKEEPLDAVSG